MKKDNMIMGRQITSESFRGLLFLGREINKEISRYLKNWSQYANDSKIRSYIDTLTNLWKEIQMVGYNCSDDIVMAAFEK